MAESKRLENVVKEESQIEHLFDMAIIDFKAALVEYKERLDVELMHARARIAQLEQDKIVLIRKNVELHKMIEKLEGMIKEWRKTND